MVMTRSSSLTQVSTIIAKLEAEQTNSTKQRLKEWYQEAAAKKGEHRRSLEVKSCFAPLLAWVVDLIPPAQTQIALAMDATSIGDRFVVLSINILLAGSGIPVAWAIVSAQEPGSWQPHWLKLIATVERVIPAHYCVIVAADRGLYADWLYHAVVAAGWHPLLRINHQGLFQHSELHPWQPLDQIVTVPGHSWSAQVTCFKTNPLDCTLLVRWDEGYRDPWLMVTDLAPESADALWYGLRATTECVYRDLKSDGWKWHHTRLADPKRAERLWLAMAVATLWMVFLGGSDESAGAESSECTQPHTQNFAASIPRQLSCFGRGLLTLICDLLRGLPIHLQSWTTFPSTPVPAFYAPNSS